MVKTGERKIENKMTGKLATSVGVTSTGERRDRVLLDDPLVGTTSARSSGPTTRLTPRSANGCVVAGRIVRGLAGFHDGAFNLQAGRQISGAGLVEPRLESNSCAEHGGDQRDSYDLQVRGAATGQERVIHGGLLNVLRMVKRQWSEGTEARLAATATEGPTRTRA